MAVVEDKLAPLERYFRILETLTAFPEGLGLAELSKMLALPKPSVHRLLNILQRSGLVAIAGGSTSYVLGERTRRLAHLSAGSDFVASLARSYLQQLVAESGETCYIARKEDLQVRSIVMESPDAPWRGFVLPGKIQQPHATACSKAILAFQADDVIDRALSGALEPLTPRTKTKRSEVKAELSLVRERGYATCIGEVDEGLAAIAVPIAVEAAGVIYALGVVGPLPRITTLLDEHFGMRLITVAAALSAALSKNGAEIPATQPA